MVVGCATGITLKNIYKTRFLDFMVKNRLCQWRTANIAKTNKQYSFHVRSKIISMKVTSNLRPGYRIA